MPRKPDQSDIMKIIRERHVSRNRSPLPDFHHRYSVAGRYLRYVDYCKRLVVSDSVKMTDLMYLVADLQNFSSRGEGRDAEDVLRDIEKLAHEWIVAIRQRRER